MTDFSFVCNIPTTISLFIIHFFQSSLDPAETMNNTIYITNILVFSTQIDLKVIYNVYLVLQK